MQQAEIVHRNLIQTIEECLEEHTVTLSDYKQKGDFFLIMERVQSSLLKDFEDTFGDATEFQMNMAKNILGEDQKTQAYGVLVNPDLRYVFAFNRRFADLDRENQRIVFKDPEEFLLDVTGKTDLSHLDGVNIEPPKTEVVEIQEDPHSIVYEYAITGGKKGKKKSAKIRFERKSLLPRIKTAYQDHEVEVRTNGKTRNFFLGEVSYETSALADFQRTYAVEWEGFDPLNRQTAKKVFGKDKTTNRYGILFNKNLQMKFAFNMAFAHYDRDSNRIIYSPAEEVLLDMVNGPSSSPQDLLEEMMSRKPKPFRKTRRVPSPRSMQIVYALVGKR